MMERSAEKISSSTLWQTLFAKQASDTAKKVVWLQKFIGELVVAPFVDGLVLLYCNNTGAIAQVKETSSYQCTKYILHRYHLIRKIMDQGDIDLQNQRVQ